MTEIKTCHLDAFTVIGLVGDNTKGPGYIGRLWEEINVKGKSIMHLAKKDADGKVVGAWGLTNDETLSYVPLDKKKGKSLYMAGIETEAGAKAPKGFTKWTVPAFDYLYAFAEANKLNTIHDILDYAAENGWEIIGSPFDFMPPDSGGQMVLFFPVRKIED